MCLKNILIQLASNYFIQNYRMEDTVLNGLDTTSLNCTVITFLLGLQEVVSFFLLRMLKHSYVPVAVYLMDPEMTEVSLLMKTEMW